MNTLTSKKLTPTVTVEYIADDIDHGDLQDLCDATDSAIEGGGGFGWVELPARDTLERYWQGVITMPARLLFVARLDGVICGTCQIVKPTSNNEAQAHIAQLTTTFVAPWARGYGLGKMLVEKAEKITKEQGFSAINLDVRETMSEAIALYEALGYSRYGTHPDYAHVDGNVVCGFSYTKSL